MTVHAEIFIPRDTVNDEEVLITDLFRADGAKVAKGEPLLAYESSKASVEVEAPAAGYVAYRCAEGGYVPVGGLVAVIADAPDSAGDTPVRDAAPEVREGETGEWRQAPDPVFSDAARRYMAHKDIAPELFAGRDLVGLDDVLATMAGTQARDGRIPAIILGGGGHGLVLADLVACCPSFRLKGYLDDGKQRGDLVDGHPVLGTIPDLAVLCRETPTAALVAVGLVDPSPALRIRVFDLAAASGALLPPFVHASATVDRRAVLGRGVQVHAGAVVGPEAVLEEGAVINSGVVISHHCRVGRHTHVAPGAILAGGVRVGAGCLVGMGVTAYIGITIGDGCVIENGMRLFRSVPAGTRAVDRR